MAAALLDSNAVSDLMRDDPKIRARVAGHTEPIFTSVIAAGELRYGLSRLLDGKKRADLESRAYSLLSALPSEPVTEAIADAYGRLKASLEGQGLHLDDNDLWLAATGLTIGATVITRDHIFSKVPGLQVEDWSA